MESILLLFTELSDTLLFVVYRLPFMFLKLTDIRTCCYRALHASLIDGHIVLGGGTVGRQTPLVAVYLNLNL